MTYNKLFMTQYEITEKEYKQYLSTIKQAYQSAYNETRLKLQQTYAKLAGIDPDKYYSEMIKFDRYRKLLKSIEEVYKDSAIAARKAIVDSSTLAVNNMYYRSIYSVQWSGNVFDPKVSKDLIDASVTGSIKMWNKIKDKELWQGVLPQYGTLSDLLNKNAFQDLNDIKATLTSSLIQGKSFRETAGLIRDRFDNSAHKALRVARTEGIRSLNNGAYIAGQQAEQLGIDITKMWDATLDTRTRQTHANADRQKRGINENYNVGGATGLHPGALSKTGENVNCRCASINLPDGIEPQTRRARNPIKEMQWRDATALERKNRKLADGTMIYPRSEQTDIIQNRSFNDWMKMSGVKYNKNGVIVQA